MTSDARVARIPAEAVLAETAGPVVLGHAVGVGAARQLGACADAATAAGRRQADLVVTAVQVVLAAAGRAAHLRVGRVALVTGSAGALTATADSVRSARYARTQVHAFANVALVPGNHRSESLPDFGQITCRTLLACQ